MPRVFNLHGDEWDNASERPGWRWRGAFVGERIGGELLGAGLYELAPGDRLWPYHTHYANEEWLLVVSGRPMLRTPEGDQELVDGDVVAFRRGEEGLHQIRNPTETPIRLLMLSTMNQPEVVHYADTGKFGAHDAAGEPLFLTRPGPDVEYWEGEG